MYKVFKINLSFDNWIFDTALIGAESKDDLIKKFEEWLNEDTLDFHLGLSSREQLQFIKDVKMESPVFNRIREIEHLYTDVPYEIFGCNTFSHSVV